MSTNTSHAAKNLKEKTVRSVARQSPLYFFIIVLVSAIPAFLEGFDTNLYSFGSPYIVQNVHGSSALLGEVGTGFALGIAIFSMVGGYLFDQFSVKYTVMGSVIIFAVFTVVTGFVTSPVELLLARLLVGVGIGIFNLPLLLCLETFSSKPGAELFPPSRYFLVEGCS